MILFSKEEGFIKPRGIHFKEEQDVNVKLPEVAIGVFSRHLFEDIVQKFSCKEAGYVLVECYNEEDIQKFRKYYAPGEELCTFKGGRLNSCRVFFAVKKNVLDIKREDFKKPKREDEYGTSVISIQFTKDETNTLSIKNSNYF